MWLRPDYQVTQWPGCLCCLLLLQLTQHFQQDAKTSAEDSSPDDIDLVA